MFNNKVIQYLNSPYLLLANPKFNDFFELTDKEAEELKELRPLIQYHMRYAMLGEAPYELLREGLDAYFRVYLYKIWFHLGYYGLQNKVLLDYCGGKGSYAKQFEADNPLSTAIVLDREGDISVDFEAKPDWYKGTLHEGVYDFVLLSEILHCKNLEWQEYLIFSSHEVCKQGGTLIIVENEDIFMAERLEELKGTKLVSSRDILRLTEGLFQLKKSFKINDHTIYEFKKI